MHKAYPSCIYVTSGQENSSCNSEMQTLSGCNHHTMTSSNTQCYNIHHCETKKVDLHENKVNLNDTYLELHESNKLHEKTNLYLPNSNTKLLVTTNATEINPPQTIFLRDYDTIHTSK